MNELPHDPPALKALIRKVNLVRIAPLMGNVTPVLEAAVDVLRDLYRRTRDPDADRYGGASSTDP